jgi:hypothetical protein
MPRGDLPSDVSNNVSGRLRGLRDAGAHAHATEGRPRLAPGNSERISRRRVGRLMCEDGLRAQAAKLYREGEVRARYYHCVNVYDVRSAS